MTLPIRARGFFHAGQGYDETVPLDIHRFKSKKGASVSEELALLQFHRYINSQEKDNQVISSLKIHTDTNESDAKVTGCSKYKSVFTNKRVY